MSTSAALMDPWVLISVTATLNINHMQPSFDFGLNVLNNYASLFQCIGTRPAASILCCRNWVIKIMIGGDDVPLLMSTLRTS